MDAIELPGDMTEESIVRAVKEALTPLKVYDVRSDAMRAVTQADVDRWVVMERAIGGVKDALRRAEIDLKPKAVPADV